ncbi:hypothetical protein [Streptomyces sp. NPDC088733]|uniref:hypothetical protein n=1 Tax=Streptomyces sp. NPDC088733 TaxID=3365880 RepID=UPI00380D35DF
MLNSVSSTNRFSINVAPGTPSVPGPRIFVTGKRGPAFAMATAPTTGPDCGDCRDFQTVMVRDGGRLIAKHCRCVTAGDDEPTRIPPGAPKPDRITAQGKPQLPMRPTPHERDGRQPQPEPGRPHAALAW